MASLYSMNPKPFMSLISVISPVPWVAKWVSTSALVAVGRASVGRHPEAIVEGQGEMDHSVGGFPDIAGWMRPRS